MKQKSLKKETPEETVEEKINFTLHTLRDLFKMIKSLLVCGVRHEKEIQQLKISVKTLTDKINKSDKTKLVIKK